MQPTVTPNGHKALDEPVITSRAEIRRQVREEAEHAAAVQVLTSVYLLSALVQQLAAITGSFRR